MADERSIGEPTENEVREAEHLPYPNLLDVVQYLSAFTKLEMRYSFNVSFIKASNVMGKEAFHGVAKKFGIWLQL